MSATIRQLSRHISNTTLEPLGLRQMLRLENANLRLQVRTVPFSLMTQNTALLGIGYKGTDRDGVVAEIISRINARSPDVVGLCEVFKDDEREAIREGVKDVYPHFREGPDESDLVNEDGGLLLLSRHPILQHHQELYRDCAGDDCLANKGIIHIRIQLPGAPTPCDIFYSHTQNPDPILADGTEELLAQLNRLGEFVEEMADPRSPSFIMGDLNVRGEVTEQHKELIARIRNPVDLWLVGGNAPTSGLTFVSDNNFYDDEDDNPQQNQRLDYILLKAGLRFIPILKQIEVVKFTHDGRFISDHFGLRAEFDQFVQVDF